GGAAAAFLRFLACVGRGGAGVLRAKQVALRERGRGERGAGQCQSACKGGADGEGDGFPVLGHGALLMGRGPRGGKAMLPRCQAHGVARGCRLSTTFTPSGQHRAIARGAGQPAVLVSSRFSRGGNSASPLTMNQTFSAMLVAWSPTRSRFLAMNSRCVQGVIARASSIM